MEVWQKAELSEEKNAVIPIVGESVALYLCPHNRDKCWECDIGRLFVEGDTFPKSADPDALIWESALGMQSAFDGVPLKDIMKLYEVWFAAVPPLKNGQVPPSLDLRVSEEGRAK